MRMDDSEDDSSSSSDDQIVEPAVDVPDEDVDEKQVYVDIKHDVFSWGRGYHGQLGLRNLKTVQWTPKKVKIKRDPRF
jgi:alpha-tubulin suppressor-like RCC1 family protein